ncbi:MAG: NifB/NifX family molybdenum-iron cluster-binding protein [Anaerohalosphaera sp.]|nr:NifB/NifX family molybdenum-iron cluster-binding protein [Anaerohalosphaera sp.]
MNIAIPIWNDCVSNVFDFAARILLVEIENNKEISRSQILLESRSLSQRADQLKNLKVDIVICGAVSRALAEMVTASGVKVLPFVTGSVDDVVRAYLSQQLDNPEFTMPGYWPGARKGFGRCQRGQRRCGRAGHREV